MIGNFSEVSNFNRFFLKLKPLHLQLHYIIVFGVTYYLKLRNATSIFEFLMYSFTK